MKLPCAGLASGRDLKGMRRFAAGEQLVAWVHMWSNKALEVRWLGMDIGFGVFTTRVLSKAHPPLLHGVADYEVRVRHSLAQVGATASDRQRGDFRPDFVTVYGSISLINAGCQIHATVALKDEDLGVGSKRVCAKLLKAG
eukprot:6215266-Prymnesium_polylepis.1